MTSTYHNKSNRYYLKSQIGAATLIVTVMLLVAAALMIIYAAQNGALQQKSSSNQLASAQAYQAAEAGAEYAFAFIRANSSTVTQNPSNGFINYTIASTTLTNGATYTVAITNLVQNSYNKLRITSQGSSVDGSATRSIYQDIINDPPFVYTLNTKGDVDVNGHGGTITGDFAVHSGGTTDSSAPATGGSINGNDNTFHDMSGDAIFSSIFSTSKASKKSSSTYYSNPGSVPWGSLTGSVWVKGDVSLSGQTTIGSSANPVTLIIEGNYTAAGQTTINGVVYVTGDVDLKGNALINGALITESNTILRGNGGVNYDAAIISSILGTNAVSYGYTRIPGTWRDF